MVDNRLLLAGSPTTASCRVVNLLITINEIGSGAKMAGSGMKWGYKAQLDQLEALLTR